MRSDLNDGKRNKRIYLFIQKQRLKAAWRKKQFDNWEICFT